MTVTMTMKNQPKTFARLPDAELELMLAGATAVGVGAANLTEPMACKHIIENMPAVMERYGIKNITDIIGGAHHG